MGCDMEGGTLSRKMFSIPVRDNDSPCESRDSSKDTGVWIPDTEEVE